MEDLGTAAREDPDILYGVPAIAAHMRLKDRQVYHLKAAHGLPVFKIGKTVAARRSTLRRWIAEREGAGR